MGGKRITLKEKNQVHKLHVLGYTPRAISKILSIPYQRVWYILNHTSHKPSLWFKLKLWLLY